MPEKQAKKSVRARDNLHVSPFPEPPLTAPLACALLRQEITIQAQIPKNAARASVLCSNMLFEFVSIANDLKDVRRK